MFDIEFHTYIRPRKIAPHSSYHPVHAASMKNRLRNSTSVAALGAARPQFAFVSDTHRKLNTHTSHLLFCLRQDISKPWVVLRVSIFDGRVWDGAVGIEQWLLLKGNRVAQLRLDCGLGGTQCRL